MLDSGWHRCVCVPEPEKCDENTRKVGETGDHCLVCQLGELDGQKALTDTSLRLKTRLAASTRKKLMRPAQRMAVGSAKLAIETATLMILAKRAMWYMLLVRRAMSGCGKSQRNGVGQGSFEVLW